MKGQKAALIGLAAAATTQSVAATGPTLESLGLTDRPGELGEAVRVRLDEELLRNLDAIESFMRGRGFRTVNRSSLIRAAITAYVDGVIDALPQIATAQASRA